MRKFFRNRFEELVGDIKSTGESCDDFSSTTPGFSCSTTRITITSAFSFLKRSIYEARFGKLQRTSGMKNSLDKVKELQERSKFLSPLGVVFQHVPDADRNVAEIEAYWKKLHGQKQRQRALERLRRLYAAGTLKVRKKKARSASTVGKRQAKLQGGKHEIGRGAYKSVKNDGTIGEQEFLDAKVGEVVSEKQEREDAEDRSKKSSTSSTRLCVVPGTNVVFAYLLMGRGLHLEEDRQQRSVVATDKTSEVEAAAETKASKAAAVKAKSNSSSEDAVEVEKGSTDSKKATTSATTRKNLTATFLLRNSGWSTLLDYHSFFLPSVEDAQESLLAEESNSKNVTAAWIQKNARPSFQKENHVLAERAFANLVDLSWNEKQQAVLAGLAKVLSGYLRPMREIFGNFAGRRSRPGFTASRCSMDHHTTHSSSATEQPNTEENTFFSSRFRFEDPEVSKQYWSKRYRDDVNDLFVVTENQGSRGGASGAATTSACSTSSEQDLRKRFKPKTYDRGVEIEDVDFDILFQRYDRIRVLRSGKQQQTAKSGGLLSDSATDVEAKKVNEPTDHAMEVDADHKQEGMGKNVFDEHHKEQENAKDLPKMAQKTSRKTKNYATSKTKTAEQIQYEILLVLSLLKTFFLDRVNWLMISDAEKLELKKFAVSNSMPNLMIVDGGTTSSTSEMTSSNKNSLPPAFLIPQHLLSQLFFFTRACAQVKDFSYAPYDRQVPDSWRRCYLSNATASYSY